MGTPNPAATTPIKRAHPADRARLSHDNPQPIHVMPLFADASASTTKATTGTPRTTSVATTSSKPLAERVRVLVLDDRISVEPYRRSMNEVHAQSQKVIGTLGSAFDGEESVLAARVTGFHLLAFAAYARSMLGHFCKQSGAGLGVATVLAIVIVMMSGCTMHQTPDGHSLWSGSGRGSVRSELGDPDLVVEGDVYGFGGSNHVTKYFYLDRGYFVVLVDNWVSRVRMIPIHERPILVLQAKAYKEEVPKIAVGASTAEVLAQFGPPDYVRIGAGDPGIVIPTIGGGYRVQRDVPLDGVHAFWRSKYVFVAFVRGRVTEVRPFTDMDRLYAFQEDIKATPK